MTHATCAVVIIVSSLVFFAYCSSSAVFDCFFCFVSRVLFSFSTKIKEKNIGWNLFLDKVVTPLVQDLFRYVLKTFGPKAPGETQTLLLSSEQEAIAADLEETFTLFVVQE